MSTALVECEEHPSPMAEALCNRPTEPPPPVRIGAMVHDRGNMISACMVGGGQLCLCSARSMDALQFTDVELFDHPWQKRLLAIDARSRHRLFALKQKWSWSWTHHWRTYSRRMSLLCLWVREAWTLKVHECRPMHVLPHYMSGVTASMKGQQHNHSTVWLRRLSLSIGC